MSENVSTPEIDLNDPTVVEKAFSDERLRSLPFGSDEFKAALAEDASKMEDAEVMSADDEPEDEEEVSDEQDETQDEQKPAKKPRGMLKRIEKLVEEKHDLQRKLEAMQAQVQQTVDKTVEQAVDSDFDKPKPRFADFDTLEDYTEALTEWKLDKRDFDRQVATERASVKEKAQQIAQTWTQRETAAKKEYSDYTDVVTLEAVTAADPSTEARIFLAESDFGPKVVYELLRDEALLEAFAQGSPIQQIKLLTKLEQRFEGTAAKPATKTTVSKAPEPPRSLPKVKTVATGKDLVQHAGEMSDAEWLRMADEYARNKRRK